MRPIPARFRLLWLLAFAVPVLGCGHTDEEMAAKQHEIDKLKAALRATHGEVGREIVTNEDARAAIAELRDEIAALRRATPVCSATRSTAP
jgi:uncharacterized small protein (DUF1192 family)